jgi:hypothetical protein
MSGAGEPHRRDSPAHAFGFRRPINHPETEFQAHTR